MTASGKLTKFPTGFQTVLVSVQNSANTLFLRACRRGEIKAGGSYEMNLQRVGILPDMAVPPDFAAPDLDPDMVVPADLAPLKTLVVTVTELRAPARKIANASVTVTDSADVSAGPVLTADTGIARVSTAGLTPPLRVLVSGAGQNAFAGFVYLSGLNPAFTNDQATVTVPLELDPPPTAITNAITVSSTGETGAFETYWLGTHELASDTATGAGSGDTATIQDLATGQYRVAVVDRAPTARVATPNLPSAVPFTFDAAARFQAINHALTINLSKSVNAAFNTEHGFRAMLVAPTSTTQAVIPLIPYTTYTASGAQAGQVIPNASLAAGGASIYTEMSATGTGVFSVTRHQLASTTPASDTFGSPVLDPPTLVTDLSGVTTALTAFDVTVSPPSALTLSTAYLHVYIRDNVNGKTRAHLYAPAASPTTVRVPGELPAATYTVDLEFVKNFPLLPSGTVAATLAEDWSKLIRPLPEAVARRTVTLTLN